MPNQKQIVASFLKQSAEEPKFDPEELKAGIKIESEHKDIYMMIKDKYPDFNMSEEDFYSMIAQSHLKEISDYYTRLKEMEDSAKG